MRKSTLAIGIIILGLGIALLTYFLSPYWCVHQIKSAINNEDGEALSSFVDFPAYRASIKSVLYVEKLKFGKKIMDNAGLSNNAIAIASFNQSFANAIASSNQLIDMELSPEGLTATLSNSRRGSHTKVDYDCTYESLDRFSFRVKEQDPSMPKIVNVLKRHGFFDWKLSALRISKPDSKIEPLSEERNEHRTDVTNSMSDQEPDETSIDTVYKSISEENQTKDIIPSPIEQSQSTTTTNWEASSSSTSTLDPALVALQQQNRMLANQIKALQQTNLKTETAIQDLREQLSDSKRLVDHRDREIEKLQNNLRISNEVSVSKDQAVEEMRKTLERWKTGNSTNGGESNIDVTYNLFYAQSLSLSDFEEYLTKFPDKYAAFQTLKARAKADPRIPIPDQWSL